MLRISQAGGKVCAIARVGQMGERAMVRHGAHRASCGSQVPRAVPSRSGSRNGLTTARASSRVRAIGKERPLCLGRVAALPELAVRDGEVTRQPEPAALRLGSERGHLRFGADRRSEEDSDHVDQVLVASGRGTRLTM